MLRHTHTIELRTQMRPEENAAIGTRLRALRQTTGMSQAEIAEMMGLTESQYGNFETGHTRIGIDPALVLVREFGVNLDWVYLGNRAWLPAQLKDRLEEALANPIAKRPRRNKNSARAA